MEVNGLQLQRKHFHADDDKPFSFAFIAMALTLLENKPLHDHVKCKEQLEKDTERNRKQEGSDSS